MKTKNYKLILLLLFGLSAIISADWAFSQTATLNNDCQTIQLGYIGAPPGGNWVCDDAGVTFNNPTFADAVANNIPFNTLLTFTWMVGGIPSGNVVINSFTLPNADAGSDISHCDVALNEVNLAASLDAGNTGLWIIDQGSGVPVDPTDPLTLLTNLDIEETIYRWRVTDPATGCTNEDTVHIFYLPVSADAGPNDIEPICADFFELNGNNPNDEFIEPSYVATGTWTQIPPTAYEIIADPNSYVTTVTNLDWGANRFRWTVSNGFCTSSDDVIVRNDLPSTPNVANDTVICNTSYFLEAAQPVRGTGEWSVASGGATIINQTLYNTQVTNLDHYVQQDVYDYISAVESINRFEWTVTYTATDGHQCALSDIVDVINLLPLPADAGDDQRVCATEVNLYAQCLGSGAMEHWWEEYPAGATPGLVFEHPNRDPVEIDNTQFNTHVEGLQTGITSFVWYKRNELDYHGNYYNNDYTVTCLLTDTVEIESVIGTLDINAGQNGTICADTITLQAAPNTSATLDGHWEVIAGTGIFDNSTDGKTFVSGLAPTTNVLRWTVFDNSQGCYYTDDVYYTNALPSNVDVGADVITCDDYARITANRPARGIGEWSFSGWPSGYDPYDPGSISSNSCQGSECNTYIYNLIPGTYDMTWTVTNEYTGPETPYGVCSIDTVMHVYQRGITAQPGVGQAVCDDSTKLFGVQPAGTFGTWTSLDVTVSFNASSIVTSINDPSPSVYGLKRGSNIFRWTIDNGTCSDWKQIVVYNDLPADAIINDPIGTGTITICDDSTGISAQPIDVDDNGFWYQTSPYTVTIQNNSSLNTSVWGVPEQKSVTFFWRVTHTETHADLGLSKSCSLEDNITIFNNSITADAMNFVPNVCGIAGGTGSTNLDANITAPTTGIWSKAEVGDLSVIDDPTAYNTLVTNMSGGKHYFVWTVSRTTFGVTCNDKDTAVINVEIPALANAIAINENAVSGATVETCVDQVTLRGNQPSSPEEGVGVWSKVKIGGTDKITNSLNYETSVTGLLNSINERIYRWTISTPNNCKSSDDVIVQSHGIIANAHINSGEDVYVCADTYRLRGNDLNFYNSELSYPVKASGIWTGPGAITIADNTANETDISGLPSGGTLNTFIWTITKGSCVEDDFVNIYNNGFTVSAGGPYEACNETTILHGDDPGTGTGYWQKISPNATILTPSSAITVVTDLTSPGDNYFTWTVTRNNCSAQSTATVTNNTVEAGAGNYLPLCEDSVQLSADIPPSGATGVWTLETGDPGIQIVNSMSRDSWARNLPFGETIFRWTLSKGTCNDFDFAQINNYSVEAIATELIACQMPVRLQGNNPNDFGGTGYWTNLSAYPIVFIDGNSLYNTRIDGLPRGGVATLLWTVSNGYCNNSTTIHVTNNSFDISAGVNDTICSNTANLSATTRLSGSGYWTVEAGTGIFANSASAITTVSGLQQNDNIMRWTYMDNGCTTYDEITIRNNEVFVSAGPDKIICDTFTTLYGTALSPGETGLWTVNPPDPNVNIVSPNNATTLVTGLSDFHSFTWLVNSDGCSDNSTADITCNYFKANAGSNQTVAVTFATMSADLEAGAVGTWSPIGTTATVDDPNLQNSMVQNLKFGSNLFEWSVDWNGCTSADTVNIIYNSLVADAGIGGIICSDRVVLNATLPPLSTGRWTVVSGDGKFVDPTNPKTEVYDIAISTINTYRWTVSRSGVSASADVTYDNRQFEINAGVDRNVCTDTITLAGQDKNNTTGVWSIWIGNGTFANPSLHNTYVSDLQDGQNAFIWSVSSPWCTNSDTVVITLNQPPDASFITNVSAGCSPIDVEYTNTSIGGNSYYWIFGEDQQTDTVLTVFTRNYEALYEKDSVFTTTLIVYSEGGCSDTTSQSITVYKIPKVEFEAYPKIQLYPDATVYIDNLSGQGYSNYYWTFGDGATQVDGIFDGTTEHTYPTWGDYTISLTVSSTSCSDTASQVIKIIPPDPTDLGGRNYAGCAPLTVNFLANVDYADGYYWEFGDIALGGDGGSSLLENPQYIYDYPGKYYVKLFATGLDGVQVPIRTDTVNVYPVPVADFVVSPDTVLLPNQAVFFSNFSTDADFYEWDFGDDSGFSFEANPIHFYLESGIFNIQLKAFTKHQCVNSKSLERAVVVLDPGVLEFPNAFTPSISGPSDGRWDRKDRENHVFHPIHRGVREYKLEIFNRWGEKVFESNDPAIGWDGYVGGKLATQDVYVWKVTAKYINGVLVKDAGDITLLR